MEQYYRTDAAQQTQTPIPNPKPQTQTERSFIEVMASCISSSYFPMA